MNYYFVALLAQQSPNMGAPLYYDYDFDYGLLASGRIDACVGSGPPVNNRIPTVDDTAFVRNAERPESIQVIANPGIVGLFR